MMPLIGESFDFGFYFLLNSSLRPHLNSSLHGRHLKGKGKGVLGARETPGAREEGGSEGHACQETTVFAIPPTNYVCKNNATVND